MAFLWHTGVKGCLCATTAHGGGAQERVTRIAAGAFILQPVDTAMCVWHEAPTAVLARLGHEGHAPSISHLVG
jgi:hypothetical protein